jgi:tRNA (guanine37-N1)-methyltransferase
LETELTFGICVEPKDAEKIRKYLSEKKLLRNDLKIERDSKYIYLPITEIPKELSSYRVVERDFEKREVKPRSYKEIISIPETLRPLLPTSYDVIGDIILIKIPKTLLRYREEVGESLLRSNSNIKTVCLTQPITGELRTRHQVKVLAGEKRTTTVHKEFGLKFHVDVKNTYFSPRLATERRKVATLIKNGETIVDMFAGVAPFSIMIAKYSHPRIIYAVDKNEKAVEFAKQNIRANNVLDKIEVIHADAKEIHMLVSEKADRIIMNLPFSSHLFFPYALKNAKDRCTIHYYDILKEEDIEDRIGELKETAVENGYALTNLDIRRIKSYAPREFYIGITITAEKMPM